MSKRLCKRDIYHPSAWNKTQLKSFQLHTIENNKQGTILFYLGRRYLEVTVLLVFAVEWTCLQGLELFDCVHLRQKFKNNFWTAVPNLAQSSQIRIFGKKTKPQKVYTQKQVRNRKKIPSPVCTDWEKPGLS